MKKQEAELYVARVDKARASLRYWVISVLRADWEGWEWGGGLPWVHVHETPEY